MRITGLDACSWPSINTLKITLGYLAKFEPLLRSTRFSSAPAKPAGQIEGNASPAQQAPTQQAAQQPVEPARVSEE